jgi:hypothetical protein
VQTGNIEVSAPIVHYTPEQGDDRSRRVCERVLAEGVLACMELGLRWLHDQRPP